MQGNKDCRSYNLGVMEHLYKSFYVSLYRYALTFLGDEDEAKDVVSDVFQSIWESWQHKDEPQQVPPLSFLYTAVRNRCLDKLRHSKACENYAQLVKATLQITSDGDIEEFERRIVSLHRAIDGLPSSEQMVLRSVYFQRLSYKEAAAQLSMSENMVHKHMVKAFRLLRELVGRKD